MNQLKTGSTVQDHSCTWLGTTRVAGPVDRVRVHKLATPLGIEPRISGFIRRSSLNLSWVAYPCGYSSRAWIRIGDRLVRGSDPHSQLEQIPDHRDMDPQYATVDQLAEITDTMASLNSCPIGVSLIRLMGTRPSHYRFREAPRMTLPHHHHHHLGHLDLLYSRTT
ncbi:hypothetical protein AAG906_002432 [Vitis piasezkii]